MKFGFNFGFLGEGTGGATNACVTKGTDGTWQGAERLNTTTWSYGKIEPSNIVSGQLAFAIKWKTDGTFVIRVGDMGNEPIPDVNIMVVKYTGNYTLGLIWNSNIDALEYEGNDIELTNELDAIAFGESICFDIRIVPNLFISYNFNLERGIA